MHQALAIADRGYVLRRGRIVLSGTVDVLRQDVEALESSSLGGVEMGSDE